ncbi:MAG: bifunctional diguanylate cyclase/phosphodiesterase [Clostridiales bacterium]|nr:bifunctional diguanylate cyclase/phosphodiesterase [Clostridiales bacterium]
MAKKQTGVRQTSLFRKIILPFVGLVLIIGLLLIGLLAVFGTFQQIHQDELHMLSEVALHQASGITAGIDMKHPAGTMIDDILTTTGQWLEEQGLAENDLQKDSTHSKVLLEQISPAVLASLSRNEFSGAFVVLDANKSNSDGTLDCFGMYLRKQAAGEEDATYQLLRGPLTLKGLLGIEASESWQEGFPLDNSERNNFYRLPATAYPNRAQKEITPGDCGYWSHGFLLNETDAEPVITYAQPIVTKSGVQLGVAGFELNTAYLRTLLTVDSKGHANNNEFVLALTKDGGESYLPVASGGSLLEQFFGNKSVLVPRDNVENDGTKFLVLSSNDGQREFYAAVQPLALYSENSPFREQQWVLLAMEDTQILFEAENDFRWAVALAMLLSLVLGLTVAYFVSKHIAGPIEGLIARISKQQGNTVLEYEATGITEVDELSHTITRLNRAVAEEASKISKIITLANMPIGAFERKNEEEEVYCSDGFYMLLNCREYFKETNRMPLEVFNQLLTARIGDKPEEGDDVFLLQGSQPARYLRLRMLQDQQGIIGTLMDVTEEIEKRKRIEHERDYDLLTNRFNRRAFERNAQDLFDRHPERLQPVSAMLMMDMDNLKSINDTYGHDSGDTYIRSFADALDVFADEKCIIGRRSGDEFYVLFYGYPTREALMDVIQSGWSKIKQKKCEIADGSVVSIGVSGGVAWYPEHSVLFPQLLHYADFAMYCVKNGVKGSLMEFTKARYEESGYLMNGIQALNKLLEQRLVRYAFQPIVCAKDASILGYELLMRPTVPELPTPEYVLRLAGQQGKLQQVEVMTWQKALETSAEMIESQKLPAGTKLFINSIASHSLGPADEKWVEEHYAHLLPHVVLEITERETRSVQDTNGKVEYMRRFSAHVAIDDFGSGYNGEHSLLYIDADYVKLDMAFVRNVHLDSRKRNWLSTVLSFTRKNHIKVIAEGVESLEELEVLCALGVDYYQGYYLARPDYQPPIPTDEVLESVRNAYAKKLAQDDSRQ